MNQKTNKLIYIFLILLPFIDFITGILAWNHINISLGLILKGLFLIYMIYYIFKNTKDKRFYYLMFAYFIIYFVYICMSKLNIVTEVINCIKIYFLPISILFFSKYKNENINKKAVTLIFGMYSLLYLIPFFLGIGHNISEMYPNKELYLSYFYIGNELANTLIILLPVVIVYLIESNSYLLKGIYSILIVLVFAILGTKTTYLSLILILMYFLITKHKSIFKFIKKNQLITLVSTLTVTCCLVVYVPKVDLVSNIETALKHYKIDSVRELLTIENIDHIIYSDRLTFLKNVNAVYQEEGGMEKLLGIGRTKINEVKNIEIDIFDIFYSVGAVGIAFYITFFLYTLKNTKLKATYKFTFSLLLVISCFTGHVLLSPMTSIFLGMLFIVSKNDQGQEKKNILLVSNMYPSKQYPHYGIFVKNVVELFEENDYTLDTVVIYKTDKKVNKIIAYLKFYIMSFTKAVINNYDYIYVHFVSHSTKGVILPYICSKNTKLVLNVHGNDIVADYEFEQKNEKRSRKYLKHADIVISPSNYFSKVLQQKYYVPKEKIVIYPSGGVNKNKFIHLPKKKAISLANLNPKEKYFGFISRIEKDKGYDTYLEAIHLLKKEKALNGIKFILVGSGGEEAILNELIEKYKLKKYIICKPLVSQEELVSIYNSLEAFIYPTRRKSESLGLTGLEAMACGTLVIGSNKYGPSDYLNETNSIPFNPEDAKALAEKIKLVLKMKAKEKKELIDKAYETVEQYSDTNNKAILLNIFNIK